MQETTSTLRGMELLILKIGKMGPSQHTDGEYCTIVMRDMKTGKTWKAWPDTTFKTWNAWKNIMKVGNVITGVGIYNEAKSLIDTRSVPQFIKYIEEGKVKNDQVPGQTKLI